jgi:hypothetical protein
VVVFIGEIVRGTSINIGDIGYHGNRLIPVQVRRFAAENSNLSAYPVQARRRVAGTAYFTITHPGFGPYMIALQSQNSQHSPAMSAVLLNQRDHI